MSGHRSSAVISTLLAAATATITLALTGTASAAVPGLERVEAQTPYNSAPAQGIDATCPAGKRVIGGGGEILSGRGQVVITDLIPQGTRFHVGAWEDQDGAAHDWSLRAYAICADPLPGWEVVTNYPAPRNSELFKGGQVWCPAGKKLLGLGASAHDPINPYAEFAGGPFALTELAPHWSLNLAFFSASEDVDGNPNPWTLTMFAICAYPVDGLQRAPIGGGSGPLSLGSPQSATAKCPDGTKVVGPAGLIDIYGNDDVSASKGQVLTAIAPDSGLKVVGVKGYAGQAAVGPWRALAFAICAKP